MHCIDVITPSGRLFGRDTIFLDEIELDARRLVLRGTIDGEHVVPPIANAPDVPFTLCFEKLLGLQMTELDFSDPQGTFVEVLASEWLARMREKDTAAKVTPEHRHYQVMTYDEVFDVVCAGYTLTMGTSTPALV